MNRARLVALDVAVVIGLVTAVTAGVMAVGSGELPALTTDARPAAPTTVANDPSGEPAASAAPTRTEETTPPPRRSALTGRPLDPATADAIAARRTIVVKIDDAPAVRTHPGLDEADLIYEVSVEGGLTRYLALFQSRSPQRVGPVRSVRTTDFDLVRGLGMPVLAFSGGNKPTVAEALTLPVIAFPPEGADPSVYWRDNSLRAPHNLFLSTEAVWSRVLGGAIATPVFANPRSDSVSPRTMMGEAPMAGVRLSFSSVTDSTFVWDTVAGQWIRFQRGRRQLDGEGHPLGVDNVVVLLTGYGVSPYDSHSPEAISIGEGGAMLLSHGTASLLRWARSAADQPFTLSTAAGTTVDLPVGRTWIALLGATAMGPSSVEPLDPATAAALLASER